MPSYYHSNITSPQFVQGPSLAVQQDGYLPFTGRDGHVLKMLIDTKCEMEECWKQRLSYAGHCEEHNSIYQAILAQCTNSECYDGGHDDEPSMPQSPILPTSAATTPGLTEASSPEDTEFLESPSPETPTSPSSQAGSPRRPYTKRKTNVADPEGFAVREHDDLTIQCNLVYGPEAAPELQGYLCQRWFRDLKHYREHVKLSTQLGHGLKTAKVTKGANFRKCPWYGCPEPDPLNEGSLMRHIQTKHSSARFVCLVSGCPVRLNRSDNFMDHFKKKHPERDTSKGYKSMCREVS
ncbi:hypothetical protein CPC08DRAFT_257180 [Agrocybe pediades]|nr:hypothetical protein CPC08DRAFT_257180 [Agrocybe pediades]